MRPTVKLWELYDITSSKRVFEKDWKKSWVPFYRAREIVKLSENWYVDNELFISEEMYKEYWEKYWLPKKNDIMVTWVGTIWICYLVKDNDKFYFKDGNILRFKNKWKDVNSRFVEYFFKTDLLKNQIQNFWSVVQTLTIQKAKEVEIPLPPLKTQKAIVAKLDQIFAELDQTKSGIQKNLDNTDELRKSALNQAFQGDWEMKKLGDCVNEKDLWLIKSANEQWYDKKFKYVKMNNIWIDWLFIEDNLQRVDLEKSEVERYTLNKGDFLFNTRNSFELVWKATVFPHEKDSEDPYLYNNNILRIRFKDYINSYYLNYSWQSQIIKQQLNNIKSWTTNVSAIYYKDLSGINIPVPPLSEQEKIVEHLDQVSKEVKALKSQYQSQLDNLEELKKSVLDKAFRWEIG